MDFAGREAAAVQGGREVCAVLGGDLFILIWMVGEVHAFLVTRFQYSCSLLA